MSAGYPSANASEGGGAKDGPGLKKVNSWKEALRAADPDLGSGIKVGPGQPPKVLSFAHYLTKLNPGQPPRAATKMSPPIFTEIERKVKERWLLAQKALEEEPLDAEEKALLDAVLEPVEVGTKKEILEEFVSTIEKIQDLSFAGRLTLDECKDAMKSFKNNETIALAAVMENGSALEFAPDSMKDNDEVVVAALGSTSSARRPWVLGHVSERLKNEEYIVLEAVANMGQQALTRAPSHLRHKITADASEAGMDVKEYAKVQRHQFLVQLQVSTENPVSMTCLNLGGNVLATVSIEPEDDPQTLRWKIAEAVFPPLGQDSLVVILPGGLRLGDVDSPSCLREQLRMP